MRLAAPPMWSHGPLPWPVSTPCPRVSTSSIATSFTTPKCLAKLTSVTIMRSREPRVQRLMHSIRPSSAYNAQCKPVPGVHRGGDKLPAQIAESGAAGLRKFEVCVCTRVCVFGGATLSVTCSCKHAWVCVWACGLCERSDRPCC